MFESGCMAFMALNKLSLLIFIFVEFISLAILVILVAIATKICNRIRVLFVAVLPITLLQTRNNFLQHFPARRAQRYHLVVLLALLHTQHYVWHVQMDVLNLSATSMVLFVGRGRTSQ